MLSRGGGGSPRQLNGHGDGNDYQRRAWGLGARSRYRVCERREESEEEEKGAKGMGRGGRVLRRDRSDDVGRRGEMVS